MIREIVKDKDGHFMCSTVKIDTVFWADTLSINIIIIRPCLQKKHVFGKILYELAANLPKNIDLQINNCMPESQQAMDKYYGGSEPTIFRKSNEKKDGQQHDYVTYTLLDKAKFQNIYTALKIPPLPAAIQLNGKQLSQEEHEWIEFAKASIYKRN